MSYEVLYTETSNGIHESFVETSAFSPGDTFLSIFQTRGEMKLLGCQTKGALKLLQGGGADKRLNDSIFLK